MLQDEVQSWDDANAGCITRGGNLASIRDMPEQDELVDLIHAGPPCPDDFVPSDELGLCVKVIKDKKSWFAASNACIEADATLMLLKDEATSNIMDGFMDNEPYWMGLTDLVSINGFIAQSLFVLNYHMLESSKLSFLLYIFYSGD